MAVANFFDPTTNILQVNLGMLPWVCRRTGTGTTGARVSGNTTPSGIQVDVSGCSLPIVAIRCPGYGVALLGRYSNMMAFGCSAPYGTAFTYYVFDYVDSIPTSKKGLFNLWESGKLKFTSALYPMKVMALPPMTSAGMPSFTSSGGELLATACAGSGGHSFPYNVYCYSANGPVFDANIEQCQDVRGKIDGKIYGGAVDSAGTTATGAYVSYDDVDVLFGPYSSYQQYGADGWESDNKLAVVDVTYIPIGATFF